MAHIICITTGLTGILHASFELVARLEAAGHEVTYACPHDVGEKVRAQGFQYEQLPEVTFSPAPEIEAGGGLKGRITKVIHKIRNAKQRQAAGIAALQMDKFRDFLDKQQPDLLLLDMELHDHILTAVAQQLPTVLVSQWFSTWERPGLPPIFRATVPNQGWRGTATAIQLDWLRVKLSQQISVFKGNLFSAFTDRRSILRAYAKSVGFPMELLETKYWPPPFTYHQLPVLSMTSWALEFPHDPRPAMYYVGPMVYPQRQDQQADPEVLQRIQNILKTKQESGKSLIYCSVSSMDEGDQFFLQKLVEAVGQRENWIMILGLGGLLETNFLSSIPSNVHPFAWVPQLSVLEQADCSINHGGIHTINECIHFRVPMLIYSGKRYDQNGCAARIDFHGIGIAADKDEEDAIAIRQKIEQLLSQASYQEKMDQIHAHYQENKGGLAKIVDQLLVTTKSQTTSIKI